MHIDGYNYLPYRDDTTQDKKGQTQTGPQSYR